MRNHFDEQLALLNTKLIEMGADVIMTDNPDVMYELLQEMGY